MSRLNQPRKNLIAIHPGDTHALGARALSGNNGDISPREVERASDQGDELVIGRAVNGRGGEPDQDGAVTQAGKRAPSGPRNNPDL